MTEAAPPKNKQTAYERWELASFGDSGTDRRMRKDDAIVNEKAAKIYEDTKKEAYGKGYTKGLQDGFSTGLERAREQVEQERETLLSVAANFQHALEMSDEHIADDVLSLALDIAQAMLKSKLKHDPESIIPIVTDAIHYLPHIEKPARLVLNHDDAKVVRELLGDELTSEGWIIHEESHIEKGGCLVETGANQIDATNQVRWKRISESFSKHVKWSR